MIQTLKSMDEIHARRADLKARGLDFTEPGKLSPWRFLWKLRFRQDLQPTDVMKSWDVDHAVRIIERYAPDRSTPVLDMGCFNSEVLYALHALGYRDIHGCDLNPLCRWMPFWNSIRYHVSDLTKTPFPDRRFGALTCLSVIEHGVPLDAMVSEVTRLLRPGGLFIFSTDFDATGQPHEIDPKFRVFNQSWRIFTPEELDGFIGRFRDLGYSLVDPGHVDMAHDQRPIHWNEQDYTFTMVALKAPG